MPRPWAKLTAGLIKAFKTGATVADLLGSLESLVDGTNVVALPSR